MKAVRKKTGLKGRITTYLTQVRQASSDFAYRLAERLDTQCTPPKKSVSPNLGEFIKANHYLTFDQYEFEGPLMHVGSKINYEDEKARQDAVEFRSFLAEKLHGSTDVMGLDIFEGHNVDIVADLCVDNLFEGDLSQYHGHFKTILCWALMEHVQNPFKVAENISKFLAPGGKVFFVGPWVWGYHPYPDDYWRISFSGIKALFPDVEWHDWWYGGQNKDVGFRISELRKERKVFQLKSDITADVDTISDRYMPYLNIFAVGTKRS